MSSLVSLDVADIARSVAQGDVTHASTIQVSPETRAHGYIRGANAAVVGDNPHAALEEADLIVLVDIFGNYDAFFQEGVKGSALVSGDPAVQGRVAEFMPQPEEDEDRMGM